MLIVRRIPATILVGTLNFTIGLASALDIDVLVNQVVFLKCFIPIKLMLGLCLGLCPPAKWIIPGVCSLSIWWRKATKRGSE